jgi:hypothetical protein
MLAEPTDCVNYGSSNQQHFEHGMEVRRGKFTQSYPVRYSQKLCFVLNAAHSNDTQCSGPGSGIDSADTLIIVIFH